jgi:hypothetical protein
MTSVASPQPLEKQADNSRARVRAPNACRLLLCWVAVGLTLGCGRPATVSDCERIISRVAELELKEVEVSDQAVVKSQIEGTQAAFRERMMSDCVGRRLRQSSLDCVNRASSANQVVSECF